MISLNSQLEELTNCRLLQKHRRISLITERLIISEKGMIKTVELKKY